MTCGHCISYLTDEDANGNLTVFHHDKNMEEGFCAIKDLFYTVRKNCKACEYFTADGED